MPTWTHDFHMKLPPHLQAKAPTEPPEDLPPKIRVCLPRPRTGILDLPNEVIDKIAECLSPGPSELVWTDESREELEAYRVAHLQYKEDLASFRLVRRKFAASQTAVKALFGTFYFLPTDASLHRLEAISKNPMLAAVVRELVFLRTDHGMRSETEDMGFRQSKLGQRYHEIASLKAQRSSKTLKESVERLRRVYKLVFAPLRETLCWFDSTTAFPINMAYPLLTTCIDPVGTLLIPAPARRHTCHAGAAYTRKIWNALCETAIRPRDVSFIELGACCSRCRGDWLKMDCGEMISYKSLGPRLSDDDLGAATGDLAGFRTINPFGQLADTEQLQIGGVAASAVISHMRQAESYLYPCVSRLSCYETTFKTGEHLRGLIQVVPALKVLNLFGIRLTHEPELGEAWFKVFKLLRSKKITGDFHSLTSRDMTTLVSDRGQGVERVCIERSVKLLLQAFVAGSAPWTEDLDKEFGISEAGSGRLSERT